ncbi:MAG: heavy metal translocating P-type ATPase [Candidatus Hydrogenedentota bacterium]
MSNVFEQSIPVTTDQIALPIAELNDPSDARALEAALSHIDGVLDVSVDSDTSVASLTFAPKRVNRTALEEAIHAAGYSVKKDQSKVELKIGGMTCSGCVNGVEKALRETSGVIEANVNLLSERANVTFDPDAASKSQLVGAVEAAGYTAIVLRANEAPTSNDDVEIQLQQARQRLIISWALTGPVGVLMLLHMTGIWMAPGYNWLEVILAVPVLAIAGRGTFVKAWKTSIHGSPNMDALIALGTSAAFITGPLALANLPIQSFAAVSAMIMAFHLTGRYIEARAKGNASNAIRQLLELGAKTATVIRDGEELEVPSEELVVGDTILVRPGGKIPTDGVILEGLSAVDESMATGESMPVDKQPGDTAIGSTINTTGALRIRATHVGGDTFLAQVIRIVQEAQGTRVPIQAVADKVTAIFVPVIVVVAMATFAAWMLFSEPLSAIAAQAAPYLPWLNAQDTTVWSQALFAAISVLVIACPCAMGLATPTALMVGTGVGAARGILIRNGEAIQGMRDIQTICLDKTGTITSGKPEVVEILCEESSGHAVLTTAASVDHASEHPLAQAIVRAAKEQGLPLKPVDDFKAWPGQGVTARIDDQEIIIGKEEFLHARGVNTSAFSFGILEHQQAGHTVILIASNEQAVGAIALADTLKPGSAEAVRQFKEDGMNVVMITGDNEKTAQSVAASVGIDRILSNIMPEGKADAIKQLQEETGRVAMVGDGINDAAALARADIGIAIGTGTDIAIESADVTLVNGDLDTLVTAIELSRATYSNIIQNLVWAFAYNLLAIPLAILGLLHPLVAEVAMAFSSVTVILNSLRLRRFAK